MHTNSTRDHVSSCAQGHNHHATHEVIILCDLPAHSTQAG